MTEQPRLAPAPDPPRPVRATESLDPLSRAGVWLTYSVLGLIGLVAVAGFGFLAAHVVRENGAEALRRHSEAAATMRAALPDAPSLDRLVAALTESREGGSPAAGAAARRTLQRLALLPSLDERRHVVLERCLEHFDTFAARLATERETCLLVVEGLRREVANLPTEEAWRLALDFQRLEADANKASREAITTLMQTLLTLLVPIATALLGYVFATRQLDRRD